MLTIKVTTKSAVMLGSGSGFGTLIDTDIVFDDYGLPVFPARRLKGLLRESAEEVLEMFALSGLEGFMTAKIEDIFGNGVQRSAVAFTDLYLPDYTETVKCLEKLRNSYAVTVSSQSVMNCLTELRQQTAINEQGSVKRNSLRTIRVLRPDCCFAGQVTFIDAEKSIAAERMLALACLNLRRVGSKRNRGLGEVRVTLLKGEGNHKTDLCQQVIKELEQYDSSNTEASKLFPSVSNSKLSSTLSGINVQHIKDYQLEYRLTTKSPVIITRSDSDENMVRTRDYIPGTALSGYFAHQYLQLNGLNSQNAHRDQYFAHWFLQGGLIFSPAYLTRIVDGRGYNLLPPPLFLHQDKQEKETYNLLIESPDNSKAVNAYCYFSDGRLLQGNPHKQINFHLVRNPQQEEDYRIEGHGPDGGIFNYEALSENQSFHGFIRGSQEDLEKFAGLFGLRTDDPRARKIEARIGRSISTQYGRVELEMIRIEPVNNLVINDFTASEDSDVSVEDYVMECRQADRVAILILTSPMILYNQNGFPEVSLQILQDYLRAALGNDEIKANKSFARMESADGFASHWKTRRPTVRMLAAGSSFQLLFPEQIDEKMLAKSNQLLREGLGEHRGEGYGQLQILTQMPGKLIPYQERTENVGIVLQQTEISPLARRLFQGIIRDRTERLVIASAAQKAGEYFNNNDKVLTSSLLGRLEVMLKSSDRQDIFRSQVEALQEKTSRQLKDYHYKNRTLYEDLLESNIRENCKMALYLEVEEIEKFAALVFIEVEYQRFYNLYWQVYFRTLRKLNKSSGNKMINSNPPERRGEINV